MEEPYNKIHGKVYKLTSNETNNVYIGSTTISLCKRFHNHKYDVKRNPGLTSSTLFEYNDVKISCLYEGFFNNRNELYDMERHYIENEPNSLNKMIPRRTRKQYYWDNREIELAKTKEWRLNNLERERKNERERKRCNKDITNAKRNVVRNAQESIYCDICGGCYKPHNKLVHERTKKHSKISLTNQSSISDQI